MMLIVFVGLIGLIVYLCVREPLLSERRRSATTTMTMMISTGCGDRDGYAIGMMITRDRG